jgi:hypothetical protein
VEGFHSSVTGLNSSNSIIGPIDALFAFNLLRLLASTCFERLSAHHQEILYTHLVHSVLKVVELFNALGTGDTDLCHLHYKC